MFQPPKGLAPFALCLLAGLLLQAPGFAGSPAPAASLVLPGPLGPTPAADLGCGAGCLQ